MEQEDIVRSEEEFTQRMAEEVFDESTGEVGAMVLLELAQVLVEVIHFRLLEIFVPLLFEVTADLAF